MRLTVAALIVLSFAFGLHSGYTKNAVLREVMALKRVFIPAQGDTDEFERLVKTTRPAIACPAQTSRTMVIVAAGQSNAANSLGRRYAGLPRVLNFFDGHCYAAVDPLMGATGDSGSLWVLMANRLDRDVIIVPMAVGGTKIAEWNRGMAKLVTKTLASLKPHYTATHILWQQGEADAGVTDAARYRAELDQLIARTREFFPASRFYVAQSTYCEPVAGDERIRTVQRAVVDSGRNIFAGPDTDQFSGLEDRANGCHFSESGQLKVAAAWARVLGPE